MVRTEKQWSSLEFLFSASLSVRLTIVSGIGVIVRNCRCTSVAIWFYDEKEAHCEFDNQVFSWENSMSSFLPMFLETLASNEYRQVIRPTLGIEEMADVCANTKKIEPGLSLLVVETKRWVCLVYHSTCNASDVTVRIPLQSKSTWYPSGRAR